MSNRIKDVKEKRKYPRIEQRLPVEVIANGYDFSTTTKNISCTGTYCHIDKYVPPFTRIMVKMSLPVAKREEVSGANVECKGVIVRTDDEQKGGFNIAVFFNDIKDNQRRVISRYIKQFLP